ncbi:MAG: ATP-binding protein [Flavobacteriaceae bacterium]|nr:ATP-binding protein [Flavobacteriaceae bacterium]MCY4268292.1 ATP-binding protein [Flavobacteriaceae bacterium]
MGIDNILDLQDNGYRSTVSALSEIIDNSIQANAKKVDVLIIRNITRAKNHIDEILIIDDGHGMDRDAFDKALQLNSGTKSNAKSGLGKYGQGLPNSSISQTKRVEVYTMQNGSILFNHIDLQEIKESGEAFLPNTEEVSSVKIPIVESGKFSVPDTGTIVRWVAPNKVKPKTAKTLVNHIEKLAGRVFRYFIEGFKDKDDKFYKTEINLHVFDFNGENYEPNSFDSKPKIKAFDPMFLMKRTQMDDKFPECSNPTSVLFAEQFKESFKIEYNGEKVDTEVKIRLSHVRKEERERYGKRAGNTPFGMTYLKRNLIGTIGYNNISIIRSGREIDSGSFGFIGDVSDNRHRWWSAEIIVDPIIDSIIGIDNKKQNASEIKFIESNDYEIEDVHEIIKWISNYLSANIKQVKDTIDKQMATVKPKRKHDGPELPGGGQSEPGTPATPQSPNNDEIKAIKEEFCGWIKERYPKMDDKEINESVDHALSIRDEHIFIKSDLGDTKLYSYKVFGTKVLIEINYNHSYYKRFMYGFEQNPDQIKSLRSVRLIIGAMVNAEIVSQSNNKEIKRYTQKLRNRMFETLDEYIEDLYTS